MSRRNKSFIWDYFSRLDNGHAQCDACPRTITVHGGSTSNMIKHFKSRHNDLLAQNNENQPKEEYIVLQGDQYEEYLEGEEDKEEPSHHFELVPSHKIKKPRVSDAQDGLRHAKLFSPSSRNVPNNKQDTEKKEEDSLDIFARYMVSLMRGMPKEKCEEAQLKIVGVILETKKDAICQPTGRNNEENNQ